jgi:hypothetical protein
MGETREGLNTRRQSVNTCVSRFWGPVQHARVRNVTQFSRYRAVCIQSGADTWSAADTSSACVVWIELNSLATGGSRGTRADQGVCPTISVQFPALGKLSGMAHECVRHNVHAPRVLRDLD